MTLYIKNPEADQLARRLANLRGISKTQAVIEALQDKLKDENGHSTAGNSAQREARYQKIMAFMEGRPRRTLQDNRSLKEICDDLWDV